MDTRSWEINEPTFPEWQFIGTREKCLCVQLALAYNNSSDEFMRIWDKQITPKLSEAQYELTKQVVRQLLDLRENALAALLNVVELNVQIEKNREMFDVKEVFWSPSHQLFKELSSQGPPRFSLSSSSSSQKGGFFSASTEPPKRTDKLDFLDDMILPNQPKKKSQKKKPKKSQKRREDPEEFDLEAQVTRKQMERLEAERKASLVEEEATGPVTERINEEQETAVALQREEVIVSILDGDEDEVDRIAVVEEEKEKQEIEIRAKDERQPLLQAFEEEDEGTWQTATERKKKKRSNHSGSLREKKKGYRLDSSKNSSQDSSSSDPRGSSNHSSSGNSQNPWKSSVSFADCVKGLAKPEATMKKSDSAVVIDEGKSEDDASAKSSPMSLESQEHGVDPVVFFKSVSKSNSSSSSFTHHHQLEERDFLSMRKSMAF